MQGTAAEQHKALLNNFTKCLKQKKGFLFATCDEIIALSCEKGKTSLNEEIAEDAFIQASYYTVFAAALGFQKAIQGLEKAIQKFEIAEEDDNAHLEEILKDPQEKLRHFLEIELLATSKNFEWLKSVGSTESTVLEKIRSLKEKYEAAEFNKIEHIENLSVFIAILYNYFIEHDTGLYSEDEFENICTEFSSDEGSLAEHPGTDNLCISNSNSKSKTPKQKEWQVVKKRKKPSPLKPQENTKEDACKIENLSKSIRENSFIDKHDKKINDIVAEIVAYAKTESGKILELKLRTPKIVPNKNSQLPNKLYEFRLSHAQGALSEFLLNERYILELMNKKLNNGLLTVLQTEPATLEKIELYISSQKAIKGDEEKAVILRKNKLIFDSLAKCLNEVYNIKSDPSSSNLSVFFKLDNDNLDVIIEEILEENLSSQAQTTFYNRLKEKILNKPGQAMKGFCESLKVAIPEKIAAKIKAKTDQIKKTIAEDKHKLNESKEKLRLQNESLGVLEKDEEYYCKLWGSKKEYEKKNAEIKTTIKMENENSERIERKIEEKANKLKALEALNDPNTSLNEDNFTAFYNEINKKIPVALYTIF